MRAPFEAPTAVTVLHLLGMVAYPVAVVGLAWTVYAGYSPVFGWVIAVAGAVGAMLPQWWRDQAAQAAARAERAQQAWRGGDPARVEIRAVQPAPVQQLPAPAGPAVSKPYDD